MGLHSRVKYTGKYNQHECNIKIRNVNPKDNGTWTCELESYVFGATRGYQAKKSINVLVLPKEPDSPTEDYYDYGTYI